MMANNIPDDGVMDEEDVVFDTGETLPPSSWMPERTPDSTDFLDPDRPSPGGKMRVVSEDGTVTTTYIAPQNPDELERVKAAPVEPARPAPLAPPQQAVQGGSPAAGGAPPPPGAPSDPNAPPAQATLPTDGSDPNA